EPLASLDIAFQRQILTLFQHYAAQGNTVLVAMHDLNLAARYCDQLILLHEGQLMTQGTPAEALTPAHLRQVYQVEARVDFSTQPPMISLYGGKLECPSSPAAAWTSYVIPLSTKPLVYATL